MGTRLADSWIGHHPRVRPDHLALAGLGPGRQPGYREPGDRIGRLAGVLACRCGTTQGVMNVIRDRLVRSTS